jgi:hypothetical protein
MRNHQKYQQRQTNPRSKRAVGEAAATAKALLLTSPVPITPLLLLPLLTPASALMLTPHRHGPESKDGGTSAISLRPCSCSCSNDNKEHAVDKNDDDSRNTNSANAEPKVNFSSVVFGTLHHFPEALPAVNRALEYHFGPPATTKRTQRRQKDLVGRAVTTAPFGSGGDSPETEAALPTRTARVALMVSVSRTFSD